MTSAPIEHVLLYRTPAAWRISVFAKGIACGALDTPPDASAEEAQNDLLSSLRRNWNFTGEITWTQTKPDWWSGQPITNPQS